MKRISDKIIKEIFDDHDLDRFPYLESVHKILDAQLRSCEKVLEQLIAKTQMSILNNADRNEQAKRETAREILDFQIKALQGDYDDAVAHQSEHDNDMSFVRYNDAHKEYWRGQAGALAKILDAVQALKSRYLKEE